MSKTVFRIMHNYNEQTILLESPLNFLNNIN